MNSQNSFVPQDVNLHFVVSKKYKSEDDCSELMWETYNACVQNELQPQWVDEEECCAIEPQKNDVFVMEEFEGNLFETLQKSKCVIVGPRCLLSCFHTCESIPDGPYPIFTNAMRGMVISASGLAANVKENIGKKVRFMGGIYSKQMRGSTTHLISDSVMSAKYEEAVGQKIPVMTERWVEAVWEINLKDYLAADDPQFDKYRCPVFMNLVATTTHLPKRQKEEVKKLIDKHGGTCMGVLDGTKVKVVVAPKNCPVSDKLKYARENNIACLDVAWVYDSIETGYSLPFGQYLVKSKNTSTPEKHHKNGTNDTLNFSAISIIPTEPRDSAAFVDETVSSIANNTCNFTETSAGDRRSNAARCTVLDRLDVREAKLAGPFLDGCNIYLAGFPTNQRDKINRILNAGSATRLDDISEALTHVIVGDVAKVTSELKVMKSKGLNPYILTLDWLEESIKLKRPAPEENYSNEMKQTSNAKPTEPPSPLSKKNIQMLQRPKKPLVPQFDIDKEVSQKTEEWDEAEESSLMKQYLQKATGENSAAERSFQEFLQPHNRTPDSSTTSKVSSDTAKSFALSKTMVTATTPTTPNRSIDDSAIPFSQQTLQFNGLTFLMTGFDKEEADIHAASIDALGGRIVSNSFVGVPDFGLVPLTGAPLKHAVDEIVTDLYIDDCVENQSVVQLKDYHRPLSISTNVKPLVKCVIATSSYTGIERTYLTRVAEALGAIYQDTFARKTNAEKGLVASTHLLCPTPEGGKYAAAIKWKIPAVTSDWLMACAAKMRLVSEIPYLVGEAIAPERPEEPADPFMGPPAAPTPRTIITPKRHLARVQGEATPSYDTPLVNKRLSSVLSNTPTSPFHTATPDTPYGQVFKENPSPETRKALKKWVDNFPDLRVEEPPLKRRAPSTPLSELRRKFWKEVNNVPSHSNQENGDIESPSHGTSRVSPHGDANDSVISNADVERAKEKSATPEAPINRKLSFHEENSPAPKKQIDLQIEQLEQVLQATSNSTESRYSLSGNAKIYNQEDLEAIDKCMVKDSQPETVGWEDPAHGEHYKPVEQFCDSFRLSLKASMLIGATMEQPMEEEPGEEENEEKLPRKRKFMLSGIKDRSNYEKAILDLGGELSSETNFDPTATHLLCIKPLRNEKMLGSIAAGNWVLHCSYLQHCEDEGKFIDEERFEWGNPQSKEVIPEPESETEKSIAAAAHRWRLKLSNASGGAFRDMIAMLLVPKEKYEQFERLIIAGSGVVVQAKPPYDSSPHGKKITHCFVQPKQLKQPVEWAMLASKGILCFQPQYLGEYLTAETPLNPRESVIAEFKKYLSLVPK